MLLDFDPAEPLRAIAAAWGDRLDYAAGTRPAEVDADALLVRPDGVVAWAGTGDDRATLASAVSRWLGDPDVRRSLSVARPPNDSSRRDP